MDMKNIKYFYKSGKRSWKVSLERKEKIKANVPCTFESNFEEKEKNEI